MLLLKLDSSLYDCTFKDAQKINESCNNSKGRGYVFQSWRKKTEIEEEVNLQIDTF